MAVIGYTRVSSEGQNLHRQTDALKAKGVEKVFTDKQSGKDTSRPGLKAMIDFIREGDTVYILSFDRLARSLADLLKLVETFKEKGVRLVSLKESVDTGTAQGKLQLAIFGALAEFQREIIAEQRDEGIASAKARGVKFGRPEIKKPSGWDREVMLWKQGKQTAVETFNKLGMSKTSFYKLVKQDKQPPRRKREPEYFPPDTEEEREVLEALDKGLKAMHER